MQREITYEYAPLLVKAASRRFIWRRAGRGLVACCVIGGMGIAALVTGVASPWLSLVAIGLPVSVGAAWWRYYRRAADVCATMPDRHVTVRVGPESISFQTTEHTSTLKWSRIKRVWRFPDVLLLFTYDKTAGYTMLPTAPLGEELRRYVEDRVREHGGDVA